jgi:hypothetical protein
MYLTRNQAYRKVPWVRIPPSPPNLHPGTVSIDLRNALKAPFIGAFLFCTVQIGVFYIQAFLGERRGKFPKYLLPIPPARTPNTGDKARERFIDSGGLYLEVVPTGGSTGVGVPLRRQGKAAGAWFLPLCDAAM